MNENKGLKLENFLHHNYCSYFVLPLLFTISTAVQKKLKIKNSFLQRNPPQTSPFNICVANHHFWWSVANAKSHLPLKGGIATAM